MIEPPRIARLPHDQRGYPIPWNILRGDDGTPFFIVNDDRKAFQALRENLCPLCGETLGKWKWFVGGPMSAFHPAGCYFDLPGHRECMEYALRACPYLAAPQYLRRVDESLLRDPKLVAKLPPEARVLLDETQIPDRPELFVAVACAKITLQDRGPLQPYLKPVAPFLDYTFWRNGHQLTPNQALPTLRGIFGANWELPEKSG